MAEESEVKNRNPNRSYAVGVRFDVIATVRGLPNVPELRLWPEFSYDTRFSHELTKGGNQRSRLHAPLCNEFFW